ncbi:unnamed protein product [Caenorhabditis sp. 36 PRJEB53466]|nr:unnamed protein product [Caenorhabditis sp. 36 PRJEB53466]
MSPGPPGGATSPPVMIPGSAPPFHPSHHHHYHQNAPGRLRDRSPRLSAEMRKNRGVDGTSPLGSASPGSASTIHRGSITQCSIGSIGLPVLGGRGRGVMSDSHMQRTFHEAMRQRRTSLPANSLSLGGRPLITGSSLSEAKGLIADMLMNKELPGNVSTCLRAVATLLEQRPLPMNGLDYGLPLVVENPYGGESMVVGPTAHFLLLPTNPPMPMMHHHLPRSSSDLTSSSVVPPPATTTHPTQQHHRASSSRGSRDLTHRGSSSRNSTTSLVNFVGQCLVCSLDFRCKCCVDCAHYMVPLVTTSCCRQNIF